MDYKEKIIALLNSQELSKEQKEKLESIFPALKESEDERIRKGLIEYFLHYPDHEITYYGLKSDSVIAWLEKKGEQKSIDDLTQQEAMDIAVAKCFEQGEQKSAFEMKTPEESLGIDSDTYNKIVDECVYGEQKPVWSEEDENRINRLIAYFEDKESFTAEDDIVYANWLKSLKDRYTWKPTTEQLRELRCVISGCSFETPILVELEESLKKLKG